MNKKRSALVSPPHFLHSFWGKVFLMLCFIHWPGFIFWLPLLCWVFGNVCIAIAWMLFVLGGQSQTIGHLATREEIINTRFITTNHTSFYLWWQKNLVKYQNVSKYYDHHCSYSLLFTSYFLLVTRWSLFFIRYFCSLISTI